MGDLPNATELNQNSVTSKVGIKSRWPRMEFTYAPIKVDQPRIPPSRNWEPSSMLAVIGEQTKSLVLHFWFSCWSPIVSFSPESSGWTWSDIQDDYSQRKDWGLGAKGKQGWLPRHYIYRQLFPGMCLFILKWLGQVACSDANLQSFEGWRSGWHDSKVHTTKFGYNAFCNKNWLVCGLIPAFAMAWADDDDDHWELVRRLVDYS